MFWCFSSYEGKSNAKKEKYIFMKHVLTIKVQSK